MSALSALDCLKPLRILVVGDVILDHYTWGAVTRISPEAPIQILKADGEDSRLGGAGNVAANLAALGARALLVGRVGRDAEGRSLARLAREAGVAARLVVDPASRTTVKTRFLAHDQQILRVDREATAPIQGPASRKLGALARSSLAKAQLVVISDYAKGTLNDAFITGLIRSARRRSIPVVVGPKRDLERFRGATALSMNLAEVSEAVGKPLPRALGKETERLRKRLQLKALLVTRGKGGILCLWDRGSAAFPARARSVYDVTGAGDTVLAVFSLALAGGASPSQAAALANTAGGLVVGKLGAATVSRAELAAELGQSPSKLKDLKTLLAEVAAARRAGKRIVFTNGCFDLIHAGHVRILEQARACGDRLVVGLNSDRSVRALKGVGRPLQGERERAAILAGLTSVDDLVLFDDLTPRPLVAAIRPDVLVKGADYVEEVVVGRREVESNGGKVVLLPLLKGASSSRLISRIRSLPDGARRPRRRGHAAPARGGP